MLLPPPIQLQLPEGDRFALPAVASVQSLAIYQGQLPAHIVLVLTNGKELSIPVDENIARQIVGILSPLLREEPEAG
jgi:hypothetical protein